MGLSVLMGALLTCVHIKALNYKRVSPALQPLFSGWSGVGQACLRDDAGMCYSRCTFQILTPEKPCMAPRCKSLLYAKCLFASCYFPEPKLLGGDAWR